MCILNILSFDSRRLTTVIANLRTILHKEAPMSQACSASDIVKQEHTGAHAPRQGRNQRELLTRAY